MTGRLRRLLWLWGKFRQRKRGEPSFDAGSGVIAERDQLAGVVLF
jgi:hypothetical protein